jgi:2-polyprenyl-3-methyl-5-hydroxy-6-metoxy-1,4-benzoquinol methylase
LGAKAQRIIDGMLRIWERNGGHFVRDDAETIQSLVLSELSPADFKEIAKLSFGNWATPTRLAGPGLPHLNRINQRMGVQVADLAKAHGLKRIRMLDLGAGLLSTTEGVAQAVADQGASLDVTAVDATPALMQAAETQRKRLLAQHPHLKIDLHLEDMLEHIRGAPDRSFDVVTISFAIHHLHPAEQVALVREAWRVLQAPGAFLVADPQEGKSDFNLKTLIYEEPEAIFAAFTSPDGMRQMLEDAGFSPVTALVRDDTGYEGYAVCGEKRNGG